MNSEDKVRLRHYVAMLREGTWFSPEQAADFRQLVDRLAEARPDDSDAASFRLVATCVFAVCGTPGPRPSRYWIYPGDRRPVVVEAADATEASAKVQRSPMYDGFGWCVYPVEGFARMCEEGKAP
jgi:hypothetical protein